MCGIAGLIDFQRDLTQQRATLERMTETQARRGPDAGGVYLARHAAFGHRRLAVIDIAGGAQPMVHREARKDRACLVYTGEVYNFKELRDELKARGHTFRTSSDTEVVLRAYLEWGEDLAQHLHGMFAFAIWDAVRETLVLVRDRLGIKPLYTFELASGILFGSEPKAIFASKMALPAVDAEGLCELLSLVRTPGHAIYRGMREVEPAEVIRVDRQGVFRRRYWQLQPREHRDDLATTIHRVRDLVRSSVDAELESEVPLCTLLSGGLDSSVIAALAQQRMNELHAGALRSCTIEFAEPANPAAPADAMRATDDMPYVRQVLEHLGTEHQVVRIDASGLGSPDAWEATLRARDLPPLGDMDTSLYLMCRAIRTHSTVALSGEGADELFGGYPWFHDPECIHADTFPWLVQAGRLGRQAVFEPRLNASLSIRDYQAARYGEAIAEVPRLPGETGLEARMREIGYLHLTRFLQNPLDRKDRLGMAVGLEIRVPYCDHELAEYLFNVPWSMKTFDGKEKSLLRAVAVDLLPRAVVERKKAAFPTTRDAAYHEQIRVAVLALLADKDAPVLSVLNRASVRALASLPASGSQLVRLGLERVLRIDQWLRRYEVRLML